MAVRTPTITYGAPNRPSEMTVVWTGLLNGDTGAPVHLADFDQRSVQVLGTFGVAGSITIEGSIDNGSTWSPLTDPQGNAITKLANALEQIQEPVWLIRPNVTAGDGSTSLTCNLFARRPRA